MQAPAARAGRVTRVLPTRTPVLLEENVVENLPVSVVTLANRHWEIVSRRTTTDSASGGGVTDGIDAGKANGTASEVSREFPLQRRHITKTGVLRSLVVATNDGRKIVARRTMTPRPLNTHDWWEQKLQPRRDIHVNAE